LLSLQEAGRGESRRHRGAVKQMLPRFATRRTFLYHVQMSAATRIVRLDPDDDSLIKKTAQLLFAEFAKHYPEAWPTLTDAMDEVQASLGAGRISRVALNGSEVIGWIGATPQYDGNVYELHPLVVAEQYQKKGIGSSLIRDLEVVVRDRGGLTIWLGSDDEDQRTSVGGIDLYPSVLERLSSIRNLDSHPFEFYLKNGFSITGILPDANGIGKPDIFLAKRVTRAKREGA
jgi:aminoglycoside 6'-N-acetyltransferase I